MGAKMKKIILVIIAVFLTGMSVPREDTAVDTCDYVEINHVYSINEETGKSNLRMTQFIWWEWRDVLLPVLDPVTKRETGSWKQGCDFVVREYLITYNGNRKVANVSITKKGNGLICIFWDRDDKVFREVVCGWMTETHTLYDVEIENRDMLHMNFRNKFQKR